MRYILIALSLYSCGDYYKSSFNERIYVPALMQKYELKMNEYFQRSFAFDDVTFVHAVPEYISQECKLQTAAGCAFPTGLILVEDKYMNFCLLELHELGHIAVLKATGDLDYNHVNPVFEKIPAICETL